MIAQRGRATLRRINRHRRVSSEKQPHTIALSKINRCAPAIQSNENQRPLKNYFSVWLPFHTSTYKQPSS